MDAFEQARTLFLEGVQHFEAGHYAQAELRFRDSLRWVPGRASTRINLAATLLTLRRPGEALAELEEVLDAEPQHLDAWCHRATALAALGRDAESLACADRVLAVEPGQAQAWYLRATALERLRRFDEARPAFERLLVLQPLHVEARFRLGQVLQRLGQPAAALDCLDRVVAAAPTHAGAWSQRGSLLKELGRTEEAAAAYERAIALGADAELHHFYLAALHGGRDAPSPPRRYVQSLFDDYADGFERHLVEVLGYRAHQELVAPLAGLEPGGFDVALDLGCGTGLCGPLLRPMARWLEGVDLSQPMLDRAASLGVYDRLHAADLVEHLRSRHAGEFDLLLAADVFIYVGALEDAFDAATRVLRNGGLFGFSVEQADDAQQVVLNPQLRYAHSLPYLRRLAAQHGLRELQAMQRPIRQDRSHSVPGLFVYLRRP
jgi:predicted TPR repeat methyltransferase